MSSRQTRTFRARRFADAMAAVKEALGPDAVIVGSQQGGELGLDVEVTAAHANYVPREKTEVGNEAMLSSRLCRRGVPESVARDLIRRLRVEAGRVPASLDGVRPSLSVVLGQEMLFAGPITAASRVVALIGPTGVGKTTTVAKLAAKAALVERRKVGLISIDNYRIGGAEQLQRYADLIGVPMEAASPCSIRTSLQRMSDCDLILIDTAGRAPGDVAAMRELATTFAEADEPIETHLCLAASTQDAQLRAIIERHSLVSPRRLITTKADEAVYHGGIVAAHSLTGLPFSYFTTGQRVPEDIEVASATRLAAWLCGEEVGA